MARTRQARVSRRAVTVAGLVRRLESDGQTVFALFYVSMSCDVQEQ